MKKILKRKTVRGLVLAFMTVSFFFQSYQCYELKKRNKELFELYESVSELNHSLLKQKRITLEYLNNNFRKE